MVEESKSFEVLETIYNLSIVCSELYEDAKKQQESYDREALMI